MLNPNTESKSNMMNHNHTFGSFEYMPMIHTIDFGRAYPYPLLPLLSLIIVI